MRTFVFVGVFMALAASARAEYQFQCYVSEENPEWTLTEGMTRLGAGFIWKQGKNRIELTTGSIGTGILARQASEIDSGKIHTYLYVHGVLVFDMTPYEPGCPNDRTWVDRDCKRILISQGNSWSDRVTFYFIDDGQPITSCTADIRQEGPIGDLECGSGRKIRLDTGDFLTANVDGIEMRVLDGTLPCSGNFGQPPGTP